nr:D-alanyl-D-alanine carboxypeptidase [Polyangiaceae bacterium]
SIASEYQAQLAIGGVDGTLRSRFRNEKKRRAVRAKTGTLDDTAALSGYVSAPPGKHPIAFSIFVNKAEGQVSNARAAIDKLVKSVADYQYGKLPAAKD